MAGIGRMNILVLLICVALLSATMANGIRPGVGGASAPAPAAVTTQDATEATAAPPPPPVAAAATTVPSEQAAGDDPFKGSKRKVPNGPDPIHNRRARWGDAPAKRV